MRIPPVGRPDSLRLGARLAPVGVAPGRGRPVGTGHDLAGRTVYARGEDGRAGQHQFSWDGRGSAGSRVAPGLYILEILVEGDAGDERTQEIISVVY